MRKYMMIVLLAALALPGLCLFYRHATLGGRFTFSNWTDRDMVRSANLGNEFQTTGAELSYGDGARLPGGAMHCIWAVPLLFSDSPVAVHRFLLALNAAAVVLLFVLIHRAYGPIAALVGCNAYLACEILYPNVFYLWNPGFAPLFLVAAYFFLYRVVVEDRPQDVKWFAGAVALGVQMHLSVALLLPPAMICLWLFRRRGPSRPWPSRLGRFARTLGLCLLVVAVVLSPHIVDEIAHDFPNTRLFFTQPQVRRPNLVAARSDVFRWDNLAKLFAHLAGPRVARAGVSRTGEFLFLAEFLVANFVFGAVLLYLLAKAYRRLVGEGPRRLTELSGPARGTFLAAATIVFCACYYLYDWNIELYRGSAQRYTLVLLPAFAILCGSVVAAVGRTLEARALKVRAAVFYVLVVTCVGYQAYVRGDYLARYGSGSLSTHDGIQRFIRDVGSVTGWSVREIAGKVSVWRYVGERQGVKDLWGWNSADPFEYELYRRGQHFPGSLDPPGGVYLVSASGRLGEKPVTAEFLARGFAQPVAGLRVLSQHRFGRDLFVVYTRDTGRCITSLSDRYLLTPEEKIIRRHRSGLEEEVPVRVELGGGSIGFIVGLSHMSGIRRPFELMIAVGRRHDGATVSLHSNQLRGQAYNGGMFLLAMIDRPTVVWKHLGSGRETVVPIAVGLVGHKGVLTPLHAETPPLPPGTYRLRLMTQIVNDIDQVKWPMKQMDRTPVEVVLGEITLGRSRPDAQ